MGRLDAGGPRVPRRYAFDNALLYTVDAIRNELDAVSRQRAGRGREIQVLQDLKVVVELLKKLSDINAHRSPSYRSANSTPTCGTPADEELAEDPSPPAFSQIRQCDSCTHAVCISFSICFLSSGLNEN